MRATEMLDLLDEAAEGQDDVSIGRVRDHLGHRGIGTMVTLPAGIEVTPVGRIPGVPTLLALLIAIVAVQMLLARDDLWLPGFLERRSVSSRKLAAAVGWLRPAARWANRHLGRHLHLLIDDPAPRVVALAILTLCCTVPVLEFVPFASSIPMGAILLFGLALVTRDGRVMALAWSIFFAALWGLWRFWPL